MKSSLIPDKPILVYPSLAATVGLEESILLSVFSELAQHREANENNGYAWLELPCAQIAEALPFWNAHDVQRISQSLRDKGILLVGAHLFGASENFRFAFNERAQKAPAARREIPIVNTVRNSQEFDQPIFGKNFIAPNWQPDEDTLRRLHQHNIPSDFALQKLPEFVTYWRDRNEAHRSWGSKFLQHVLHQWRKFEAQQHKRSQEINMPDRWRPSPDAMQVLVEQAQVSREFIEDAIPEFILYWQERGDKLSTWNSKFIQHIKLQWHKYNSSLESNTQPRPIPANWRPSEEVFDVLRLANIEINFARELIPEFVMYWQDSKQIHTSWNTRFLQHTKRQWARRHATTNNPGDDNAIKSTREMTLEEELGDRSWAYQ